MSVLTVNHRTWTDNELVDIMSWKQEGLTFSAIAAKLDRSRDSVAGAYCRILAATDGTGV